MQRQGGRRVIGIAIVIVLLGLLAGLGFRYWYQPTYDFVETDDAQVQGDVTRVAAPASGQIVDVFFEGGNTVNAGDILATIKVVSAAPNASIATPAVPRLLTRLTSPVDGRVAVRNVSVGDTVAPGQPVAAIANLQNLWVVANIDEARIDQLANGQSVDVNVGALNQIFAAKIAEIGSATTEFTNPPVGGLGASDSTKKVPVRIEVTWIGAQPVPGETADVTIHLR